MRSAILLLVCALLAGACTPVGPQTLTFSGGASPTATVATQPTATAAATIGTPAPATQQDLPCTAPAALTVAQTEGPFYKANPPERTSLLEPGTSGTVVLLRGRVLTRSCQPVANAVVDFWQTDAAGNYDNSGFRFRGQQRTDAQGRYTLETILPAEYPGRTPHIHVKVTAPGRSTLISQLYLPDASRNSSDSIFSPALVMTIDRTATPVSARFNFIVDLP